MAELLYTMTNRTPEIVFSKLGILEMKGRLLPEDANSFFKPLIELIKGYSSGKIEVNFRLEHVNTSSSMRIVALLQEIEKNDMIKLAEINWFYEENDSEMLELGYLYKQKLSKMNFNYIECKVMIEY